MIKIKWQNIATLIYCLVVFSFSIVEAQPIERIAQNLVSGGYYKGKIPIGSTLEFNEQPIPVDSDGYFLIGFSREQAGLHELTVTSHSGVREDHYIWIDLRRYDESRVVGVDQTRVTPPKQVQTRIEREYRLTAQAKNAPYKSTAWRDELFEWPIFSRLTGHYGSQRYYNGTPGNPHWGVDMAAKTGTPVYAPASGRVTLAQPDLYFSGGTVVINHGQQLISSFLHLSKLKVEAGQEIQQGDILGYVGSTGRSTGPHLDWRMSLRGIRIDPELWVPALASLCLSQPDSCEQPNFHDNRDQARWLHNMNAIKQRQR